MPLRTLALCACLAALAAADPAGLGPELVADGGFEAAPGPWSENNWARNQVEFARDRERPWRGAASQRMAMTRVVGSADLQLSQRLPGAAPGQALRIALALRGQANVRPVLVELRGLGAPYVSVGAFTVPVTQDWQETAGVLVLPAAIPQDLGLVIHLRDEGAVWLDGVSVRPVAAVDPEPVQAGGLLANGSFEAGRDGWSAAMRGHGPLERAVRAEAAIRPGDWAVVDDPGAPDGRRVLRVRLGPDGRTMTDSAWFPYRHGRPLHLSLDLAGPQGQAVEVSLVHGEFPDLIRPLQRTVRLDGGWTRHAFTCTPGPSAHGRLFVQLAANGPAELRVDRVRVWQAEGAEPPAVGCTPVSPVPGNAYRPDERPRLRIEAAGQAPGAPLALIARVEDAWGRTVAWLPAGLACDAAGRGAAVVDLPADRLGGFRVAVEQDGALVAEHCYAVVPRLPAPDGSGRSFFGGHFPLSALGLDLAERGGFRWLRLHPPLFTKWAAVEPEPGRFDPCTAPVEEALRRGFSVLGSLDAPPAWASAPGVPGPQSVWSNREPRDWGEWASYVTRTIRAFPGIRAWEVWNEPDGAFLLVKPGEDKAAVYRRILDRTCAAVEAAGLDVRLVGVPVASLDRPFQAQVLEGGGAARLDVVAFHYYFEDVDPVAKRPSFIDQLARMRALPNRAGAVPAVWHTEGGMWIRQAPSWLARSGCPPVAGSDQLDGARGLVRQAVAFKALGLERHFQYAGLTSPAGSGGPVARSECTGLFDVDGSARPAFAAHAAMVALLDDAEPAGIAEDADGVVVARFASPRHGRIAAAWSRTPRPLAATAALAGPWGRVLDLMGNPPADDPRLGPDPLFCCERP